MNFDSPRDSKKFTRYWDMFVPDIKDRPNLKASHLYQLQILCDLCVEYDDLKDVIDLIGRTITNSGGRNGDQVKLNPEVVQMNKVLIEIRNYSRMLGLLLVKDTKTNEEEEENEFS